MSAPWWTGADQAELDLLIRDLAELEFTHRDNCQACAVGEPCSVMRDAIETVVDWRDRRSARSFAVGMRARQDLVDMATMKGGGRS